jgi:abequosyltransferase
MNNKLLSICIPTYNRSEILDNTLKSLFSNPEFDNNLIEVIVSDNCSTDNTHEIVKKYPIVRYYRNNINVTDKNFTIVLSYAVGEYIKLFNDTLIFKKGALKKMLNIIDDYSSKQSNLFFYSNMFLHNNCLVIANGKDNFLKKVSFHATWVANFGSWKSDFDKISNKNKYAKLHFLQVDWSFKIVENTKTTLIYFEDFFDVVVPPKKGGYNLFDVFVNKYLSIIKKEKFALISYEIEKYRLCRYFVYPWFVSLFITDKQDYSFQTKGLYKILLKKYWYEPYFYPMLILFWIKKFKIL